MLQTFLTNTSRKFHKNQFPLDIKHHNNANIMHHLPFAKINSVPVKKTKSPIRESTLCNIFHTNAFLAQEICAEGVKISTKVGTVPVQSTLKQWDPFLFKTFVRIHICCKVDCTSQPKGCFLSWDTIDSKKSEFYLTFDYW